MPSWTPRERRAPLDARFVNRSRGAFSSAVFRRLLSCLALRAGASHEHINAYTLTLLPAFALLLSLNPPRLTLGGVPDIETPSGGWGPSPPRCPRSIEHSQPMTRARTKRFSFAEPRGKGRMGKGEISQGALFLCACLSGSFLREHSRCPPADCVVTLV